MIRFPLWHFLLPGLLGSLSLSASSFAQCHYEATVISAPPCHITGPPATQGMGLSDTGEVVGYYFDCIVSNDHAFRWHPDTGFQTASVGWAGAIDDRLYDVNADGLAAGAAHTPGLGRRSYTLSAQGEVVEIPIPAGGNFTQPEAINELGDVTGFWGSNVTGVNRPFVWRKGVFSDIGPDFGPLAFARAFDSSDIGQIVGWQTDSATGEPLAFLWCEGQVTDLGPIPHGLSSEAYAVNNYGLVVGGGKTPTANAHQFDNRAFIWQNGDFLEVVEPWSGFQHLGWRDVNDRGVAAGTMWCAQGCPSRAVIYVDGLVHVLNDLLVEALAGNLSSARVVNAAGQILCDGALPNIGAVAVLLTPVDSRPTDLTGDCRTDADDLAILLSRWNTADGLADLDGNSSVGFHDLIVLLIDWHP